MRNISWYIDTAIERSGVKSNRKFCELLGVSCAWIVNTRKGSLPTDETMIRLARIADVPPHIALLDLNIMRSKGQAQAVYKKLYEVANRTALALVLGLCFIPSPTLAMCQMLSDNIIYYVN